MSDEGHAVSPDEDEAVAPDEGAGEVDAVTPGEVEVEAVAPDGLDQGADEVEAVASDDVDDGDGVLWDEADEVEAVASDDVDDGDGVLWDEADEVEAVAADEGVEGHAMTAVEGNARAPEGLAENDAVALDSVDERADEVDAEDGAVAEEVEAVTPDEIGDELDDEVDEPESAEGGPVVVAGVLFDQDDQEPLAVGGPEPTLDPAALQVLISRLTGIAEEMGAVLRRAAFSPNIKERADCSAALFDAGGELLVQAEHIPVHLGSMPAAVAAAIDAFGEEIEPGEQIVLNDPFAGGTHLNDITVVAPVHVHGELIGWVANRAHHADLGGATPGSIPPEATEIQQEGLRLPPVRLTHDVREVIVASSRTPEERRGDLDAQWGANVVGMTRLAAEAGQPFAEVTAYGERRMRAALAELPDGEWDFTDVLDSTGPRPEQHAAATICVCVKVDGDAITFDFTGTDEQRSGNMNAVEAVTVSAVSFALRAAIVPDLEGVGGSMRPVTVIAPEGTLVAARPPVAVGAGNVEVSQRIADVCLGALAQVVPDRVAAASQGTMNNVLLGGDGWVYYETVAGGQGARPDRDGMSGVHTGMTNTKNTPTEALERAFPLRVKRYRLRSGSGGEGRHRGGEGIERDLEVLEPVTVSLITERRVFPPWGLEGGGPGAVGENWLLPGGDEDRAKRLGDKCTFELKAGDVLRISTPGGGGHGPPPTLAE